MRPDILFKIRTDKNLDNYIKYHSYWYRELSRNPERIIDMENDMKKEYKLTTADKIEQFGNKLKVIRTFMDVFK